MDVIAKFFRKGEAWLLLVLLSSCSHPTPWHTECLRTNDSDYDSSKLTYKAHDPIRGIDLTFLKTKTSSPLYLTVRSVPIPALKTNPKEANLILEIEGEKTAYTVPRHEGGHKLSIPHPIQEILVSALKAHHPVTIHLEGYITTLTPHGFLSSYEKFQHPFPIANPFYLIK